MARIIQKTIGPELALESVTKGREIHLVRGIFRIAA